MKNEDDKLTGTITNMDTDESWVVEFKVFPTDVELMAIVRVENIEIKESPGEPLEIEVICLALDSIGLVYNLHFELLPDTDAERDQIMADMKPGAIFMVKGRYCMERHTLRVSLMDVEYLPLPPELNEEEIREVFRVNSDPMTKMQ